MKATLWLIVAILLGGCVGGEPTGSSPKAATDGPPIGAAEEAPEPVPTEDTGALAVTVLTSEVQPVGAASVTLTGTSQRAHTDLYGRATFNGLQPGSYTILAAKPGYRTVQDRGRIVDIRAQEITSVKLTLEPVALVTADTSYHRSHPFKGFIACGTEVRPPAIAAQSFPCGRGVSYSGQTVGRDPNDNSTHPFALDNVQVQAWLLESRWTPSQAALGSKLFFRIGRGLTCSGTNCNWERLADQVVGGSPLRWLRLEGPQKNITRYFGSEPKNYPTTLITDVRVACGDTPPCAAAMVQQNYVAYLTVFYGKEPTPDFSMFPK